MSNTPIVVSLPIADRRNSYRFYRDGLGLDAVGEPAEDSVPEPLQFALNDGARIMLVPTGGFSWVIGRHARPPWRAGHGRNDGGVKILHPWLFACLAREMAAAVVATVRYRGVH